VHSLHVAKHRSLRRPTQFLTHPELGKKRAWREELSKLTSLKAQTRTTQHNWRGLRTLHRPAGATRTAPSPPGCSPGSSSAIASTSCVKKHQCGADLPICVLNHYCCAAVDSVTTWVLCLSRDGHVGRVLTRHRRVFILACARAWRCARSCRAGVTHATDDNGNDDGHLHSSIIF